VVNVLEIRFGVQRAAAAATKKVETKFLATGMFLFYLVRVDWRGETIFV
jgi:hypothetical protein